MTFKEAKKILEKEGYFLVKVSKGFEFSELPVWEKPEVVEAKRVVNKNGFATAMNTNEWLDRQERLKKEYGKNHIKGDFSWKNSIIPSSPALKESASQFNDALLDEQAKKIERLKKENAELLGIVETMKQDVKEVDYKFNAVCKENERLNEKIRELINEKTNLEDQITILNACKKHNDKIDRKQIKRLGKEISKLNGIIHKKNLKIEELGKESFRHLSGKVKMFGENVDLEQMLKDKNAVLADVAEELRLSKIREKNLVEVSQKYMKENEELKNNLADKVVVKIDAQALKSAESALAYKEKVIAEKDEVIADLTHELKAKHKKYVWYKGAYDAAQQILNTIADYAAKHPDKKFSDQMVGVDNAEEGKDHSAKVVLCGKDVVKKFKENEESVFNFFKRHKETAVELYEVADEALDQLLLFGEVIIKSEK